MYQSAQLARWRCIESLHLGALTPNAHVKALNFGFGTSHCGALAHHASSASTRAPCLLYHSAALAHHASSPGPSAPNPVRPPPSPAHLLALCVPPLHTRDTGTTRFSPFGPSYSVINKAPKTLPRIRPLLHRWHSLTAIMIVLRHIMIVLRHVFYDTLRPFAICVLFYDTLRPYRLFCDMCVLHLRSKDRQGQR